MKVAILGGTGDIGAGLALRWAKDTDHEIRIGSREAEKADEAVSSYRTQLAASGYDGNLSGGDNLNMTEGADIVLLAAPPEYVTEMTRTIGGALADDAILVSPAVKLRRDGDGFHAVPPASGSLTAEVAAAAPAGISVVGAFHSLAAGRLSNLDAPLGIDTAVVGDDPATRAVIIDLANEIDGLRGVDAGPLSHAAIVESLAPLCINVARYNEGLHHLGVRFA